MPKFFHELSDEEYEFLLTTCITWGEVAKLHPQPEWCNYPGALDGILGCWSLIYRQGVGVDYCKNCDEFNFKHAPNNPMQATGLAPADTSVQSLSSDSSSEPGSTNPPRA